jgi:hypothetical protein
VEKDERVSIEGEKVGDRKKTNLADAAAESAVLKVALDILPLERGEVAGVVVGGELEEGRKISFKKREKEEKSVRSDLRERGQSHRKG